jgi:hypothetical protein
MADLTDEQYKEKIDKAGKGLEAELVKWEELGLEHPAIGFKPDLFLIACGFDTIKDLLVKKGVFTQLELTLAIKKAMLETMIELRKRMEVVLAEERKQAIVARVMPPINGQGQFPFNN